MILDIFLFAICVALFAWLCARLWRESRETNALVEECRQGALRAIEGKTDEEIDALFDQVIKDHEDAARRRALAKHGVISE